jgi:hypothetical protein
MIPGFEVTDQTSFDTIGREILVDFAMHHSSNWKSGTSHWAITYWART